MQGIETLCQNFIEGLEAEGIIAGEEMFHKGETVFIVQHVEVADHIGIFHIRSAKCHRLVENGQSIPHGSVCLVGDDVKGFVVDADALLACHHPEVPDYVLHRNPVEVVGLAAGEYGRENLVLLGGCKYKYGVCRRLLEGFEEGVEGLLREHMHLVYDIDTVFAHLRRHPDLVHKGLDVFHSVVGCGIELVYAIGPPFRK